MSDESEATRKPARALNRWRIGSLSAFQTLLLAFVVLCANYLAFHHYQRVDLSRDADYSLSPATRRYLASDAVQKHPQTVKWIMAYRRSSPFYERVRALAEEYAKLSNGRVKLEVVDPIRSPDRVNEMVAAYGITLVRDLILIDARSDDKPAVVENADKTRSFHPNVKVAVADDMGVFSTSEGKRKISAFRGEDVLTARLVEAIEGRPRRMALIVDKSQIGEDNAASPRRFLIDTLRFQNIEVEELQMSGLEKIPDHCEGVILAAPKYDLSPQEIAVLENYWNRPRAAILTLIKDGETPPNIRAFLRGKGVTPRKDRVITRHKSNLVTNARGTFTKGVTFTADLAGQTTEFGGASSSLEVREGAADLLNKRILPMGLIEAAPGFWGETRFGGGNEKFDEREDNAPPLNIAACVIRGAESDDRFAADSSRMIVISNTDFLSPENHRAENLDFLASSVNWMVGRESLAGIGPRALGTYKLPLLEAQVSFINRINLFFIPAAFLLIGTYVWSARRA